MTTSHATGARGLILSMLGLIAGGALAGAQEPSTGARSGGAGAEAEAAAAPAVVWNARHAEHLLNRAAFGARTHEVERAVAVGHAAMVEALLAGPGPAARAEDPYFAEWHSLEGRGAELRGMSREERNRLRGSVRRRDREQLADFLAWWVDRMVRDNDPLRERMTLFWHGHFTSSYEDVRNSYEMIAQNQLLRKHALGSFETLVHGIARDAAMLEYLDNDANRKGRPNENFARELLELFTLGEGNYTEADVKEAARAFTGWTDRDGEFEYKARLHDAGEKTFLGRTGPLHGTDVIDVVLEQEASARHVATRIVAYFEGREPSPERAAEYAAFLREHGYDVRALLRKLFHDPAFYRDEVVGTRISGPVEYLVGAARRTGIEPPPRFLVLAASLLGQSLFAPPNVKGWEGGTAWVDTGRLMQRGNLVGIMLGVVRVDDVLSLDGPATDVPAMSDGAATMDGDDRESDTDAAEEAETMDGVPADGGTMDGGAMDGATMDGAAAPPARPTNRQLGPLAELRRFRDFGLRPRYNLSARLERAGAKRDAEVVRLLTDELLGVRAGADTRARLAGFLRAEREQLGIREGRLLRDWSVSEPLLRRLAHLILSLPEAQLH